jgi:glycosyltransferase involved in cell wall biosynthesis
VSRPSPVYDVCLLTTGFPRWEGDLFGAFVLELARALSGRGLRVCVVAPHDRAAARHERVGDIDVRRFRYCLPGWQRLAYGDGMPTNLRRSWAARLQVPLFLLAFLWAALRQARHASLLHCQWTISGLIGHLATCLVRRPVVLTVRGSDFHLSRGLGARINAYTYRHVQAVLTVSQDLADRLQASGVPAERIHVVPNGVDERFSPADPVAAREELGLPVEGVLLLFVGLLVPVKGLSVLLEALESLKDLPLTTVLVGDGSEEPALRRQAEAAGLDVLFAGRQPATQVHRWMAAADALVLPSLSEGRPNVVLEAQATGLAVVATAVGGTPELIDDGRTGVLVPVQDPDALAAALRRVVDDAALRQRLGTAGRSAIVEGGLTWEASAERTCGIYRNVLAA